MKKNFYILFAVAAILLTACSSIDCNLAGRIQCHYAFKDVNGSDAQLNYPLSVILLRQEVGTDTTYINQQSSTSTFDLPMSNVAEADLIALKLTIDTVTTISDTMRITKTNTPTFEDIDCAARYRHEITAVSSTHNFIDTLIINNPQVSNDASVTNLFIRVITSNQ